MDSSPWSIFTSTNSPEEHLNVIFEQKFKFMKRVSVEEGYRFRAIVLGCRSYVLIDVNLRSYIPDNAANFIVVRFNSIGYLSELSMIVQRPRTVLDW